MVIGVVIINDGVFAGSLADRTGPAVLEYLVTGGHQTYFKLIPAEEGIISEVIVSFAANPEIEVIVTCGGIGIGRREVVPEATRMLFDQELPGIAELVRRKLGDSKIEGYCTCGVSGIVAETLVINLPAAPGEVLDALKIVEPLLKGVTEQIIAAQTT